MKGLTNDAFELKGDDGKIKAVAYVVETYGLIYNKDLLKKAGHDASEISDFDSLKKVVEDITKRKDELGFAAFTSAGMDSSDDWRFKTHLANLPIYYEYKDEGITSTDAIKGTYLPQYRNIWDLYINNATCEPGLISTKTADDADAEFVTEQAVFYQNGTWDYANLVDLDSDKLGMLPIYIGGEPGPVRRLRELLVREQERLRGRYQRHARIHQLVRHLRHRHQGHVRLRR